MKSVIIIAIAVVFFVGAVFAIGSPSSHTIEVKEEFLISVQTDDDNYDEGDLMTISGNVSNVFRTTITLQVVFDGKPIFVGKPIVAKDGNYSYAKIVDRKIMPAAGNYTLRATYGDYIGETEFTYYSDYDVRNEPPPYFEYD